MVELCLLREAQIRESVRYTLYLHHIERQYYQQSRNFIQSTKLQSDRGNRAQSAIYPPRSNLKRQQVRLESCQLTVQLYQQISQHPALHQAPIEITTLHKKML